MKTPRAPGLGASRRSLLLGATAALWAAAHTARAASDAAGSPSESSSNSNSNSNSNSGIGNGSIVWPPLRMLDGSTLKAQDWQGVPVVVVFWATWCPYCKRHNAHIEALHQASVGKTLRVLGVAMETEQAKVASYMQANQFHFPVALADSSFRAQFSERRVVPLTCLVSAKGRLVQAVPGEWAQDDVMALATASWA